MPESPSDPAPRTPAPPRRRRNAHLFRAMALWAACQFLGAGTLAWGRGWLMLALLTGSFSATHFYLKRVNPAVLAARRANIRPTTSFDRAILPVFMLLAYAIPAVAGVDAVRHHAGAMAPGWLVPGLALLAAGIVLITWAMAVNPFLEATVRIQSERGHQVISGGPYRFVRHPMYVGCCLYFISMPLILGSWWAILPAGGASLALVIRTFFEDRLLRRELPGYEEFTRRTPWRLIPGIF